MSERVSTCVEGQTGSSRRACAHAAATTAAATAKQANKQTRTPSTHAKHASTQARKHAKHAKHALTPSLLTCPPKNLFEVVRNRSLGVPTASELAASVPSPPTPTRP